jgi:hypothetical protein
MPVVYHVINRSDATAYRQSRHVREVSIWMLGRKISNWIIVKSDSGGDRVVATGAAQGCVTALERILTEA